MSLDCPHCGRENVAESFDVDNDGAVLICFVCGGVGIYDSGVVRKVTARELEDLAAVEPFRIMLEHFRYRRTQLARWN